MSLAAPVTWRHYSLTLLPSQVPRLVVGARAARATYFPHANGPEAHCSGYSQTPLQMLVPPTPRVHSFSVLSRLPVCLVTLIPSCREKGWPEISSVSPGVKAVLHLQQITPPRLHSLATEPSFRDGLMEVSSAPTRCTRRGSVTHFLYVPFTGKRSDVFLL